jgi:hypothetical protein
MSVIEAISRKTKTIGRRTRRWLYQRAHPRQPTVPVFIVACQRSGTSMAMDVFERSFDALVYHTGDRSAYDHGLLLDDEIIRRLLAKSRAAVTVFKPMNQIQSLKHFLSVFPGLRVVWLLRDYRDVVNSGVRRWDTMRDTLRRVTTDPANAGWHGEAIPERLLEVVRAHYHDEMSLESAYALFWYLRNRFYFELSLDSSEQVRMFRYEDLVSRPLEAFTEMFAFCGCPFHPHLTTQIFDTSIGRYEPPKIDPAIATLCEELARAFDRLPNDVALTAEEQRGSRL